MYFYEAADNFNYTAIKEMLSGKTIAGKIILKYSSCTMKHKRPIHSHSTEKRLRDKKKAFQPTSWKMSRCSESHSTEKRLRDKKKSISTYFVENVVLRGIRVPFRLLLTGTVALIIVNSTFLKLLNVTFAVIVFFTVGIKKHLLSLINIQM